MLRYNTAVLRYNTGLLRYNKCPPSTAAPACGAAACVPAAVLSHPPRGLHDRNESDQAPPCGVPVLTDMQWDAQGNMRPSPPPPTNTERQREFRRLSPDYYRLLQAPPPRRNQGPVPATPGGGAGADRPPPAPAAPRPRRDHRDPRHEHDPHAERAQHPPHPRAGATDPARDTPHRQTPRGVTPHRALLRLPSGRYTAASCRHVNRRCRSGSSVIIRQRLRCE
jgi:hypothetical protein